MAQQLEQQIAFPLDPVVHRVAGDERRLLDLVEHAELQLGVDVSEEDILGVAELLGNARPEVGEDAEPGLERLAAVEIVRIARFPAKRLALLPLHPGQIDPALRERGEMGFREVGAHDTHHLHRVENRAGHGEEHRRAAERVGGFAERGDHRIEGNRADDEQTHVTSVPGRESPRE